MGIDRYHSENAGYLSAHHRIDIAYKTPILYVYDGSRSGDSKQGQCSFFL
jgi:hypothetical protein